MGCKESKLAVATAEPIKRPKSAASSRTNSRRIERLDSDTTTTSVATTSIDKEKAVAVESKGCQTMDYCQEEGIEEKFKNGSLQQNGIEGSSEVGNDLVVSDKGTGEEEGDGHEENLVFGEGNTKIESVMDEGNENKEKKGEEMKEVETFQGREHEQAKIEQAQVAQEEFETMVAEESHGANDKLEVVEKEAEITDPVVVKAKTVVEEAQIPNDQAQVAQEEVETMATEEAQGANDKLEPIEKEVEIINPIVVKAETVVEETERIVLNNVDYQVQATEQEEVNKEGDLGEVEAETVGVKDSAEALDVNDKLEVVEKEEDEPTKVEDKTSIEDESKEIMPNNVVDMASTSEEKINNFGA